MTIFDRGFVRLLLLGFLCIFVASCGDSVTDVTFRIQYADTATQSLVLNSGRASTARVWYSNTSLGSEIRVQPAQAVPTGVLVTDPQGEGSVAAAEFSTASNEGYSIGGGLVTLRNFPMSKAGSVLGLEIIQQLDTTGYYVVAYATYQPTDPNRELSKDQLISDSSVVLTLRSGRSCGRAQGINITATDTAGFKARCN